MALEHLRDFLMECEVDTKVAEVARLVSILGEAAFEDKIVPTRLMNKFYEHYLPFFGYKDRPIAAKRIYEDIDKDKWTHDRLQETYEAAAYIFMKYEKEIVKAKNTEKVVDFIWKWRTLFRFLIGGFISGSSVLLLVKCGSNVVSTVGDCIYCIFLATAFLFGIFMMLCCDAQNW